MPEAFLRCVKNGGKVITKTLSGGKYIKLCKDKSGKWFRGEAKTKKAKVTEAVHGRNNLFDSLKDLRNKIAKEKNIPSYIVFNDKSLNDMCSLMPRNDSEFLLVYGVGQSKLENYGKDFLSVIRQFQ